MAKHAVLSPSGGTMWMVCGPSARLNKAAGNSTSTWADEGTLAHRISEYLVKFRLRRLAKFKFEQLMAECRKSKYYTKGLYSYCDIFADYVIQQYNRFPNAVLLIEEKVDLSGYIPEGFGSVDYVILSGNLAVIIDLKFGKGVEVSAKDNTQQKIYTLGVLVVAEHIFRITKVEIHIYQPRIDNIDVWEVESSKIVKWGKEELTPKALIAFEGKGEFVAGPHCKFCKVKARCRALFEYAATVTNKMTPPHQISDDDLADILDRMKVIKDWLYAVNEYALNLALNKGKQLPGYKVVRGRADRKFTNEQKVIDLLEQKGFSGVTETSLLGITALEAKIGKRAFEKYVAPHLEKGDGRPTLVPLSDKRTAFNSLASAKEDFKEFF